MAGGLTGDWHYGCTTHSGIDPDTLLPSRLIDTENTIRQLFESAHEMGLTWLVIMGDLFHKNSPPATYIARFIALMREMIDKYQITVIAYDGNHDFNGQQGQRNATASLVEALRGHSRFVWVDKPQVVVPFGNEFQMLVVPHKTWKGDHDLSLDPSMPLVVVGHWAIEGAISGAEETLLADEAVDDTTSIEEAIRTAGCKVAAFWSGHIHKAQQFTYHGVPVVYPGSIERIDFGEREDEKGFVALTYTAGEFVYDTVALETRRFIQVTQVVDERWSPSAVFWPESRDAILKIKVTGKDEHSDLFIASEVRDYILQNLKPAYLTGFDMEWERTRQVRDEGMNESMTIDAAFNRYVERNLPVKTAKEKDFVRRVAEVGTRIIKEVSHAD